METTAHQLLEPLQAAVTERTQAVQAALRDLQHRVHRAESQRDQRRSLDGPPPTLLPWFEHGHLEPPHQDYVHNCMLACRRTIDTCILVSAPWRDFSRFHDHIRPDRTTPYNVIPGFKIGNAPGRQRCWHDEEGWRVIRHHVARLCEACGGPLPLFVLEDESALKAFWTSRGDSPQYVRPEMWQRLVELGAAFPDTEFLFYPVPTTQWMPYAFDTWGVILHNLFEFVTQAQAALPALRWTATPPGFAAGALQSHPGLWTLGYDVLRRIATRPLVGNLSYQPTPAYLWPQADARALAYTPHELTYVWTAWGHIGSLLRHLDRQLRAWPAASRAEVPTP